MIVFKFQISFKSMESVIDHRRDNLLLEINTSGFNIFWNI